MLWKTVQQLSDEEVMIVDKIDKAFPSAKVMRKTDKTNTIVRDVAVPPRRAEYVLGAVAILGEPIAYSP